MRTRDEKPEEGGPKCIKPNVVLPYLTFFSGGVQKSKLLRKA